MLAGFSLEKQVICYRSVAIRKRQQVESASDNFDFLDIDLKYKLVAFFIAGRYSVVPSIVRL